MNNELSKLLRVNIDEPKFDMSTYIGRAKHFFLLTNPLNMLVSDERLERARAIIMAYRSGADIPYVKTMDDVWREKYLYDSAYHPETGEKISLLGRMAGQVPCNTILVTSMVAFYKTRFEIIFFQILNQTYNAFVTYSNRSGSKKADMKDLLVPYISAVSGAIGTAMSFKRLTSSSPPIIQRLVTFIACAAANCVNIPMMRMHELNNGIKIFDRYDCKVGYSRKVALIAISEVVLSRILMALPPMILPPVVVERLRAKGFFDKYPKWNLPIQAGLVGFSLIFSTPLGCAVFRQKDTILVEYLEAGVRDKLKKKCPELREVFYNKGL